MPKETAQHAEQWWLKWDLILLLCGFLHSHFNLALKRWNCRRGEWRENYDIYLCLLSLPSAHTAWCCYIWQEYYYHLTADLTVVELLVENLPPICSNSSHHVSLFPLLHSDSLKTCEHEQNGNDHLRIIRRRSRWAWTHLIYVCFR